jgi:hypothetical protein
MLRELNREEKTCIVLTLVGVLFCYNFYSLFSHVDFYVGFPFYPGHLEPIQWYAKDLGFRIAIFLLAILLYYLIKNGLNNNYNMLLRGTIGFLAKDILDYIVSYDQFTAFWDIIAYIGIILYVVLKK